MTMNFTERLRHHIWLLWFLLGFLCLAIELIRRDKWWACAAVGFAIAGLVGLAHPVAGVVAGVVAAVAACAWVWRHSRRA